MNYLKAGDLRINGGIYSGIEGVFSKCMVIQSPTFKMPQIAGIETCVF